MAVVTQIRFTLGRNVYDVGTATGDWRRYGLEHLYPAKLTDIVEKLHEQAVKDGRPHLLFALAEVNYLRVFMATLRRKIETTPARPRYVLTEQGVGYRLATES